MCFFHAVIYEGTDLFVQFENHVRRFGYAMTASQPSCLTARFTFVCESPVGSRRGSRNAAQWQTFVSVGPRKKAISWSRRCPTAPSKSSTSNVTDMPSGKTGQSGLLSIANVPARCRTRCNRDPDRHARLVSIPVCLRKRHGRGSCR